MIIRKHFWPTTITDAGCFLLLSTFIPITFIFEIVVVLPDFHEPNGTFFKILCIGGFFVIFNIIGNMLACMLIDTSIKKRLLCPPKPPPLRKYWHYCTECETLTPPRARHCKTCRTCMLKRDHHCHFAGCCIGHFNVRYFLIFVLYIAVGSGTASIYNALYFYYLHGDEYANSGTIVKMFFPMFVLAFDASWSNLYLFIHEMNFIAFAYSTVMLCYHAPAIRKGGFDRESWRYDLGLRRNLVMIFGKRMHWVWLSPLIKSELPHNGVNWENILQQSNKNR